VVEMSLRVAVAGGSAASHDPHAALALADARLAAAAAAGARLLVLPQRFLTVGASLEEAAILSDAPALRVLGEAARRHGVAVACGYLERCSGRIHDAALFVDERGCALANYRRTHLDPAQDPAGLAPGQWLNQVSFAGTRLGLLVGADIDAPEPARALALAGAAILLLPGNRGAGAAPISPALLRTRAFENGCGLAFANLDDAPGAPPSLIVGPDGEVLAQAAAGLAVADLPTAPDPEAGLRLAARRPPLYQRLIAPHPEPAPVRA
jgi:predicted amidohydrolase